MLVELCQRKTIINVSYNIVTVEGAAASRVFSHLKAEAVRVGDYIFAFGTTASGDSHCLLLTSNISINRAINTIIFQMQKHIDIPEWTC